MDAWHGIDGTPLAYAPGRLEVDLLEKAQAYGEDYKLAERLGRELGTESSVRIGNGPTGGDPGSVFVNSEAFRKASGSRSTRFSTGLIDVGGVPLSAKGTLLESPGGGGAGLVSVPQQAPGLVDKLFQKLTVEGLLLSGVATSPTVRTVVQGTATSGAAGVAEGGLKPQSTLGFTTTDEQVKKVATTLKLSDEVLEDAAAIRPFINGQLALFVQIEVEPQLLRGTAGGNEVQGLLTSRGVPVYAGGTAVGNKAVQVFKAMNGMRGSAFVEPRLGHHQPHRLGEHPPPDGHRRPVLRRRPFPGPPRQRHEHVGVRAARRQRQPVEQPGCTSPEPSAPAPPSSGPARAPRCGTGAACESRQVTRTRMAF